MTWLQSLRSALLGAIDDLDQILDFAAERFHQTVMLRIGDVAGELDGAFDGVRAGAGTDLALTVRRSIAKLDDRYQRFIVRHIDPLFGRTRMTQLEDMGGVDVSPMEQYVNRGLAFAAGAFIVIVVGGAIFPGSLSVTVPLSFTIMLPVYQRAIETVREQRRVTYNVVTAVNSTGIWPARRSVIAGLPPRYGTWTMSMPATIFRNSPARWWLVFGPELPNESLPGLALA